MPDAKTPKVLILLSILALAAALMVAGCGGSGGSTGSVEVTSGGEGAPPTEKNEEAGEEEKEEGMSGEEESGGAEAEEEGMSEREARSGAGSLAAEGKEVFTSTCGSCHTLQAAGTSGEVGPDLDQLEPDLATVEHQVVNGGGGMPAFGNEGVLDAKEIKAVATYVSSVAGQG
ncbi:MAG TPA: cytochrome c [Solirubrobacterales bacterium]|nr:cytochrome c [Solirubrobacterales bacterium]